MLNLYGWIDGITASIIVIFGIFFGFYYLLNYKKFGSKQLLYVGMILLFFGLLFLGVFCDFLFVLFTGNNIPNPDGLVARLSYIWMAPLFFFESLIWGMMIFRKRKQRIILMIVMTMLSLITVIIMLMDPMNSFYIKPPDTSGTELIDYNTNPSSIPGILLVINYLVLYPVALIALFINMRNSEGIVKRRFQYFIIAILLGLSSSIIESTIVQDYLILIIGRIIFVLFFIFVHLTFREIEVVDQEIKPVKKTKVQDGLFRVSKIEPGNVSEEDITYYKEQKKCLVCKGKAEGFNIYVCPECDALYCQKCARSLSDLENACWSCNHPFDSSKATKPYEKEDGKEIKIAKDEHKKE